jgi:hypothetical protein
MTQSRTIPGASATPAGGGPWVPLVGTAEVLDAPAAVDAFVEDDRAASPASPATGTRTGSARVPPERSTVHPDPRLGGWDDPSCPRAPAGRPPPVTAAP